MSRTIEVTDTVDVLDAAAPPRLAPTATKVSLTAAAAAALAACGGGTDLSANTAVTPGGSATLGGDVPGATPSTGTPSTGTPSTGTPSTGTPSTPAAPANAPVAPTFPATQKQAVRFLLQAGMEANDKSINSLMTTTYARWIDEQMAMPRSQGHCSWLTEKGFDRQLNDNIGGMGGLDKTMWRKFFSSPDGLRQKAVLAWSQMLVVSYSGLDISWRNYAVAYYLDKLETHAFDNFRTLLEAITLTPAMGNYLDMRGNVKANPTTGSVPDENFAREIMQLFTIGLSELNPDGTEKLNAAGQPIETYTNEDVQGLAAVFTGWNTKFGNSTAFQNSQPMVLTEGNHSTTEKRFLGVTIEANTKGLPSLKIALDTLFNHANTAPFVAKHLIQRFTTSNPTPAYVGRVAAVFADNGQGVRGDLGAVIKAVLLDAEARLDNPAPTFGKLREPMMRLFQWGRTFGASSAGGMWDFGYTFGSDALDQMPMMASSVFNFFRPDFTPPNTSIANAGLVAPEFQLVSEPTVVGYVNYMQTVVSNTRDVKADYTGDFALASLPSALVDRYNLWLAAGQLSEASLNTIKQAIQSIAVPSSGDRLPALRNRIYAALVLIMSSPEYLIQK